ncbi:hypothetical protein Aperf_G00000037673 [Anoplocephala perfoliata]
MGFYRDADKEPQRMPLDEDLRYTQALTSKQATIEHLESEISKLKEKLAQQDQTYDAKVTHLSSQLSEVIGSMERHAKALADATTATTTLHQTSADGDSGLIVSLRHELEGHRVQSRQHARTICMLEERLMHLAREASEAQVEVLRLRAENRHPAKKHVSQGVQVGIYSSKFAETSSSSRENDRELIKLRNEVNELNILRDDQNKEIQQLREQKAIAEAKASDLVSAASEVLKKRTEATLESNAELQSQLVEARCQVEQLTRTADVLKSQLSEKEKALSRIKAPAQSARKALGNVMEKKEAFETDRPSGNANGGVGGHATGGGKKRPLRKIASPDSPTIDCRIAGHEETIAAQKAALAEMRRRLQYLSSNASNGLSSDELISLEEAHRREVLDLRRQVRELHIQLECARRQSNWNREYPNSLGEDSENDISCLRPVYKQSLNISKIKALKKVEENYFHLIDTIGQFFASPTAFPIRRSSLDLYNTELREHLWAEQEKFAADVRNKLTLVFDQLKKNADTIQAYEAQISRLK